MPPRRHSGCGHGQTRPGDQRIHRARRHGHRCWNESDHGPGGSDPPWQSGGIRATGHGARGLRLYAGAARRRTADYRHADGQYRCAGGTACMLSVGLTGGLGSGKSFVGSLLADLGCLLIQADQLGHQVIAPGGEAYEGVVREFGPKILNPDGAVNRRRLATEVFGYPERLEKLNALVHPPVRARVRQAQEEFGRREPNGIAVTEAAILIETESYRDYARLIVAVCRPEQQIERAMARDHLTREEVLDRLRWQMPLEEKVRYADYVIDTSGSKENTLDQTGAVYESLRRLTV